MITIKECNAMQTIEIRTVDKDTLADVQNLQLETSLSKQERMEYIMLHTKNPYCFRYGDFAVKVEFTDDGPSLKDLLKDFFIRNKSNA